ncbi:terminase small subunit [Spirosoma foliorum]|uniref:Uncharacterized protein n=1 Tax=Spirosoma foliorum TaxID=2710596 RepID=A0A7G5H2G6_9BACT|nr:terminase small subunit [Spirosoma foliorum]QMW05308.1 hypothetical protein H3H32_10685 [Spirosoma foliorum]
MPAPKGNKYALGNQGGRPPIYSSVEDLATNIEAYFTYCEGESHEEERTEKKKQKNPTTKKMETVEVKTMVTVWDRDPERPTWTNLALFLGFESRKTLHDYSQKEEFSYPIKRALTIIESIYEDALMSQGPTGAIFALKNLGWTDSKEVTGKDGGPIQHSHTLTPEDVAAFSAKFNKTY